MALPKKGYKPGVYRVISGTIIGNKWSSASALADPQEGYVSGIYRRRNVTIDANGDTSVAEDDIGISRAVNVQISAQGIVSEVAGDGTLPQEGYVPGIYRRAAGTAIPQEGINQQDFTTVIGQTNSGIWD